MGIRNQSSCGEVVCLPFSVVEIALEVVQKRLFLAVQEDVTQLVEETETKMIARAKADTELNDRLISQPIRRAGS